MNDYWKIAPSEESQFFCFALKRLLFGLLWKGGKEGIFSFISPSSLLCYFLTFEISLQKLFNCARNAKQYSEHPLFGIIVKRRNWGLLRWFVFRMGSRSSFYSDLFEVLFGEKFVQGFSYFVFQILYANYRINRG